MAKKYYLPRDENALASWSENYRVKIAVHGAVLGLTAGEITAQQTSAGLVKTAIEANVQAQHDAQEATALKDQRKALDLPLIQQSVARIKTSSGYTAAIGEDLGVVGDEQTFDVDAYKPEMSASVFPGKVRLDFKKKGVKGVKIYGRLQGQPGWNYLDTDTRSPYEDTRPLTTPNTPETREYMAIGMIDDEQVGQPSDVVTVVYGG